MIANNSLPKISIVIPTYNAESDIKECLDSVFNSTFKDFEVIVVDDYSTDNTINQVSSYPCKLLRNDANKGPAFSRNYGVDNAQAGIILFIDSDIIIPTNLLEKVFKFFKYNFNASVLQARYSDEPYYRNIFSQYKHYVFSFRGSFLETPNVNYIHTACVAVKKEVFKKVRFNESLRRREDVEFGLRCLKNNFLIYADLEIKVIHKKKYSLLSFSKYQFNTAYELTLQIFKFKDRNLIEEFQSREHSFYKKLWFLRPVLSIFLLVSLIWLFLNKGLIPLLFFIFIILLSFIVEYPFRFYLFKKSPIYVSFAAWFIYFYDGILICLGAATGILQLIFLNIFKIRPAKNI